MLHVLEQEADNVVTGIVSMIRPDDVVIMGASEQGVFEQRLFGNIPEHVMRLSPSTIIMCKSYQGEMVKLAPTAPVAPTRRSK
ncbi:MAG: universal stress protein [Ardenticatenia bacterium]|nr:universal stress protein [Ardenticatenia bacterium]